MLNKRKISFDVGCKTLEPLKYKIKRVIVKRWWLFNKIEYNIEMKYISITGINSLNECLMFLRLAGVDNKDIIICED